MTDHKSNQFKITVLGSGGVGKSAITIRFVRDKFIEDYDPTIEDSYKKELVVDNENAVLTITDTAGEEVFCAMLDQWIREGQGFLLVYSIITRSTFDEAKMLYEKIKSIHGKNKVSIILVGNKCDLTTQRQVQTSEGADLANTWGIPFFETSANTHINITQTFESVVRDIRKLTSGKSGDKQDKPAPKKQQQCCVML